MHSLFLCCGFGDKCLGWVQNVSLQFYMINTIYNLQASLRKILITSSPEHILGR